MRIEDKAWDRIAVHGAYEGVRPKLRKNLELKKVSSEAAADKSSGVHAKLMKLG